MLCMGLGGDPRIHLSITAKLCMIVVAGNQEMDMIGGDHIIQYGQSKSLPGFEGPAQPAQTVFAKFQ